MARYGLHSARWLKNGWLAIVYRDAAGRRKRRMVRPGESVSMAEAARALDTYRALVYRLKDAGHLKLVAGASRVPWRELIRLRRAWRGKSPTTVA